MLANDTDADGGTKQITSATQPANGTVVDHRRRLRAHLRARRRLLQRPGAEPTDDFTYTLNGGSTATVAVTVTCVDDAPVAVDDPATVAEDSGATAIDVLANDTDVDGGPKPITVGDPARQRHGRRSPATAPTLTYKPDADYCNDPAPSPTDDFTYTLNGGSTATVAVTVTCVDDAPVAVDDTATVAEDSDATAIDVLANDTDADGGTKPITVGDPARQRHRRRSPATAPTLTYKPDRRLLQRAGAEPTDDFTYTLNGGSTATVAVTVDCVDDAPVAVDDTATVAEDSDATTIDVLANDTDADGGTKPITSATQPAHGTVVIAGDGAVAHLQAERRLLQRARRRAHRQLHLHPQRRLDRDRRGDRRPAPTTTRSRSTTPRPSPRTPTRTAIDVLANDTDATAAPS